MYLDIKWCDHFTTSDWIWRHLVKWVICRYQDQMSKVYLFLNYFYFHKPKQKPNQTKHKILIALRTNSCCCSYWAWTMRWKMLFVLPLLWCTIANFFLCPSKQSVLSFWLPFPCTFHSTFSMRSPFIHCMNSNNIIIVRCYPLYSAFQIWTWNLPQKNKLIKCSDWFHSNQKWWP